ncbi:hypothetical protein BDY21DRAFT_350572 [Lineolata rhizophorae]|uniref:NYN domain-containing protein n=1 Tax=Lineolata rhizophorae TaxID=578093 RepID=A0A6A6NV84_9PEZI|nr:hypothetical protein BDY21DRAFT_350572 [Lineolata rhizophorae]
MARSRSRSPGDPMRWEFSPANELLCAFPEPQSDVSMRDVEDKVATDTTRESGKVSPANLGGFEDVWSYLGVDAKENSPGIPNYVPYTQEVLGSSSGSHYRQRDAYFCGSGSEEDDEAGEPRKLTKKERKKLRRQRKAAEKYRLKQKDVKQGKKTELVNDGGLTRKETWLEAPREKASQPVRDLETLPDVAPALQASLHNGPPISPGPPGTSLFFPKTHGISTDAAQDQLYMTSSYQDTDASSSQARQTPIEMPTAAAVQLRTVMKPPGAGNPFDADARKPPAVDILSSSNPSSFAYLKPIPGNVFDPASWKQPSHGKASLSTAQEPLSLGIRTGLTTAKLPVLETPPAVPFKPPGLDMQSVLPPKPLGPGNLPSLAAFNYQAPNVAPYMAHQPPPPYKPSPLAGYQPQEQGLDATVDTSVPQTDEDVDPEAFELGMPLDGGTRHLDLRHRLINDFARDRDFLILPPWISNLAEEPEGIHVFVDASNILIGFFNTYKMSLGLDKSAWVAARSFPPMSFEALTLIMERRRPVAKRELVGSELETESFRSFNTAEKLGYNVSNLARVRKATQNLQRRWGSSKSKAQDTDRTSGSAAEDVAAATMSKAAAAVGAVMRQSAPAPRQKKGEPKNVEQGVDELIHLKMMESIVDTEKPTTMVLASGDAAEAEYSAGFLRMVERALQKGWRVEVFSFACNISSLYNSRQFAQKWSDQFTTVPLDRYVDYLYDK